MPLIKSNKETVTSQDSSSSNILEILAYDQGYHTNIQRVQNYLTKTIDLASPLNTKLINETDMTMYIKGIGKWDVNNANIEMQNLFTQNENAITFDNVEPIIQDTNEMLDNVTNEVFSMAKGPDPKHEKLIPDFPITIVVIGKPFVGKTTQVRKLTKKYALQLLNVEDMIESTIQSYKTKLIASQIDSNVNIDELQLTETETLGKHLKDILDQGNVIDDDSYINLIFSEINKVNSKQELKINIVIKILVINGHMLTKK